VRRVEPVDVERRGDLLFRHQYTRSFGSHRV
jgi:hypothetical protein